jgi:hypothetical protein
MLMIIPIPPRNMQSYMHFPHDRVSGKLPAEVPIDHGNQCIWGYEFGVSIGSAIDKQWGNNSDKKKRDDEMRATIETRLEI